MMMSIRSSLIPPIGSLLAPESKNARNARVLRNPFDAVHHCQCKFLLISSESSSPNLVSSWRVGYNSKKSMSQSPNPSLVSFWKVGYNLKRGMSQLHICRNKLSICDKSHVLQKELDGSVLQRTSLAFSSITYEEDEEDEENLMRSEMLGHIEKDEDIHMLMAEDNFNWEPKSRMAVDLKAKPCNDIMGSNSDVFWEMHATDGYHGSYSGKILNSIFRGDGIDLGKHYEKLINEDPQNPMLLRNYGHYLYQFKGNLVEAENCYLPALFLDPENGQYLAEYGMIAWELHHSVWITEYFFKRAIKSSPDDPLVHAAYAWFLYQIAENDED